MGSLTPEQLLGARVLDVLTSLSQDNLRAVRQSTPEDGATWSCRVPRHLLRQLAEAFEAAYPGTLDRHVERVYAGRRGAYETRGEPR